jgi:hypothetical protein
MARYHVRRGPDGTWEAFLNGAAEASLVFDSDADVAEFIRALAALDPTGMAVLSSRLLRRHSSLPLLQ